MTDVDLGSRDAIHDPGAVSRARERGGAVQWSRAHRAWVLLSHAEVRPARSGANPRSTDQF